MYEINLPREFVHPPLYLLQQESKPKTLAKRMALALRPTLRGSVQIGYKYPPEMAKRAPKPKPVKAVLTPPAAKAVSPAGRSKKVVMGQPVVRITNMLPEKTIGLVKRPLTPRRVPIRAGLPMIRLFEFGPPEGVGYAHTVQQHGQAAEALKKYNY